MTDQRAVLDAIELPAWGEPYTPELIARLTEMIGQDRIDAVVRDLARKAQEQQQDETEVA